VNGFEESGKWDAGGDQNGLQGRPECGIPKRAGHERPDNPLDALSCRQRVR